MSWGVRIEDVHVTTGDTRRMGYAVGTFASRAAVMSGNAIAAAAREVREKAIRIAADVLEANPDDLQIEDGIISVKGAPASQIALSTVAVLSNPLRYAFDESAKAATQFAGTFDPDKPPVAGGDEPGLEGKGVYSPTQATFANGMHAAIVETDPVTAEIKILRYCVVHDCGVMINPMIVEGQVHGGVAQESVARSTSGWPMTSPGSCSMRPSWTSSCPTPLRCRVETDHLETPSPLNPLGIKGAGEAGTIPVSAVIASAMKMPRASPSGRCRSVRASCGTSAAAQRQHIQQHERCVMKISGSNTLAAPVDKVWDALLDPEVLARCIPGCESLTPTGPHSHIMRVTAGVAAIKGTYDGSVALLDLDEPHSLTMKARGAGAPGTIEAAVAVKPRPRPRVAPI